MTDAAPPISDLADKTRYEPSEVEPRIEALWLESGLWHAEPDGAAAENYSIAVPPPNITGVLHMGHALNLSIQDTLARAARQRGLRVKWIHGTDHAGIATQTQVERDLVSLGTSREAIGRDQFISRVWAWRENYGYQIVEQQKRLGASLDFEDERFTMDTAYAEAVMVVFKALYDKGYVYRDRYLVNWDPGSLSAISDLEIVEREAVDTLYYIDYPLESGEGHIQVATVRPETMFADVAVAVNPSDERYRELIGQFVTLPIVGTRLEIIADDYVKPEFGTGALKITPGHDPNDFEIGRRHDLAAPSAIGEDGRLTGVSPAGYQGLTVKEAQVKVVEELRGLGVLAREEEYRHAVPYSDRSGSRVEPLISLQWFMRMDELAEPAIQVVKDGRVRFHPQNQANVYLNWMENIRPWCISRQLWWGHQIPVWYHDDGRVHCDVTPPDGDGWTRDPDVLDTWFSSGLWPFATLGWPERTDELQAFYPTDVLSTARDIIFLWVARMIMLGLEFAGDIPFSEVYIHSVIQAPDGQRMSKSKGTGVDPLALINGGARPPVYPEGGDFPAYGADAVRWGLLSMSSAQDVRFNEEKIAQGRQLTNKLWNAARLILMRIGPETPAESIDAEHLAVEDRWILARLSVVKGDVARLIRALDFAHAAQLLYDFVYEELCDWYLELIKPRLDDPALRVVALHVLTDTLTLAHPVIPFVTEEIYSYVPGASGLLAAQTRMDDPVEFETDSTWAITDLIAAVTNVRAWRDSAGVRPSVRLAARLESASFDLTAEHLARLPRLEWSTAVDEPIAVIPVPGGQIAILPSDEVDLGAADAKRDAERAKLESEIERAEKKLANQGFVAKARPDVVEAERTKLERLRADLKALDDA